MNESRSWWSPCNDRGLMTDVAAITQINPQRRVESVMRFRKRLEHNEHVLTQSSNPVTNLLMSIVCYRFKPNWTVGDWALPKIWFGVMAASYLLQKSSRTQNIPASTVTGVGIFKVISSISPARALSFMFVIFRFQDGGDGHNELVVYRAPTANGDWNCQVRETDSARGIGSEFQCSRSALVSWVTFWMLDVHLPSSV